VSPTGHVRRPRVRGSTRTSPVPGFEGRFDAAGWHLISAVFRLKKTLPRKPPSLIDLGMGRGRDLIYFGSRGFRVLGVDISAGGIEKAKRRAARYQIPIRTQLADLRTYRVKGHFDVVFSSTTLNHFPPRLRAARLAHFKAATIPGGIHAVNAFVPKPPRSVAPDMEPGQSPFRSGELRGYYRDWQVLESGTFEFGCHFGGAPHRHSLDVVVARKPEAIPGA
jgi:ubiquinone/menaquinone biosynthesis C-methylase UbiE